MQKHLFTYVKDFKDKCACFWAYPRISCIWARHHIAAPKAMSRAHITTVISTWDTWGSCLMSSMQFYDMHILLHLCVFVYTACTKLYGQWSEVSVLPKALWSLNAWSDKWLFQGHCNAKLVEMVFLSDNYYFIFYLLIFKEMFDWTSATCVRYIKWEWGGERERREERDMKRARVIDVDELVVCVIPIVHFLIKCAVLIKFIWRNIV